MAAHARQKMVTLKPIMHHFHNNEKCDCGDNLDCSGSKVTDKGKSIFRIACRVTDNIEL